MTEGLRALTPMELMSRPQPLIPVAEPLQPVATRQKGDDLYQDTLSSALDETPREWLRKIENTQASVIEMPGQQEITERIEQAWDNIVSWVWGATETKGDPGSGIPSLEAPGKLSEEDIRRFIEEMNELVALLKDSIDDLEGEHHFELFLQRIFKEHIQLQEETARQNVDQLAENHHKRQRDAVLHRQVVERLHKRSGESHFWGLFENALTLSSLASSALEASSTLGTVAMLCGMGVVGEQMIGDPGKRSLARLMGQGDQEKEEQWLERLRVMSGLAALGTYLGVGGMDKVNTTMSLSRAGATGNRGWYEHVSQMDAADSAEVTEKMRQSTESIKRNLGENKRLVDTIAQFYKTLGEVQRNQLESSLAMIRR